MKIYIASKTVHAPTWLELRVHGFPIISSWIDEAGVGMTADFSDLWRRCIDEAKSCDRLVAYRATGETLKGAYIEIGAALSAEKPVVLVGDFDGMSFVHHPLVSQMPDVQSAMQHYLPQKEPRI